MKNEILKHFGGSHEAMAVALGVTRAAVTQWFLGCIPSYRALQIELITDGKFKAVEIYKKWNGACE